MPSGNRQRRPDPCTTSPASRHRADEAGWWCCHLAVAGGDLLAADLDKVISAGWYATKEQICKGADTTKVPACK